MNENERVKLLKEELLKTYKQVAKAPKVRSKPIMMALALEQRYLRAVEDRQERLLATKRVGS
jgi:hypothetical protein